MDKAALVIVSQQSLFRQALANMLSRNGRFKTVREIDFFGEHGYADEVLKGSWFLVDAQLGEQEVKKITEFSNRNQNKVIVFGSCYDTRQVIDLMPLKADGYLATDLSETDLLALFEKVEKGGPVIADSLIPDMLNKISDSLGESEEREEVPLTPRENEILELLAKGYTNHQIADKLIISVYTVKNHVHNILEKLGSANRAQLVSYALSKGLVSVVLVTLFISMIVSLNVQHC